MVPKYLKKVFFRTLEFMQAKKENINARFKQNLDLPFLVFPFFDKG